MTNRGGQQVGEGISSVSSLCFNGHVPKHEETFLHYLSTLITAAQCPLNQDSSKLEVHGDTDLEAPSTVRNGAVHFFTDGSNISRRVLGNRYWLFAKIACMYS